MTSGAWSALQSYFYWWVILSFIWGLVAAFLAFFLPIIESRFVIYGFLASVFRSKALARLAAQEMPDEYGTESRHGHQDLPDPKAVPRDDGPVYEADVGAKPGI